VVLPTLPGLATLPVPTLPGLPGTPGAGLSLNVLISLSLSGSITVL
jgi:hypothetical protein